MKKFFGVIVILLLVSPTFAAESPRCRFGCKVKRIARPVGKGVIFVPKFILGMGMRMFVTGEGEEYGNPNQGHKGHKKIK